MGYDIYNANPLRSVDPGYLGTYPCEMTYYQKVNSEDGLYVIPDDTKLITLNSCSSFEEHNQFQGVEEM